MSMIEKFLENKSTLHKSLDEIREEALRAAEPKADALIDEFIEGVKAMVAEATDEEFVAFITSGKLDDEDLNAVIMFRAEAAKTHSADACEERCEETNEKRGHRVHVFVLN